MTHQGPSAGEIAALPKWDQRHAKQGKSEGQVEVFQRSGKAIAAQWSAASSIWIEVGEVRLRIGRRGGRVGSESRIMFPSSYPWSREVI